MVELRLGVCEVGTFGNTCDVTIHCMCDGAIRPNVWRSRPCAIQLVLAPLLCVNRAHTSRSPCRHHSCLPRPWRNDPPQRYWAHRVTAQATAPSSLPIRQSDQPASARLVRSAGRPQASEPAAACGAATKWFRSARPQGPIERRRRGDQSGTGLPSPG